MFILHQLNKYGPHGSPKKVPFSPSPPFLNTHVQTPSQYTMHSEKKLIGKGRVSAVTSQHAKVLQFLLWRNTKLQNISVCESTALTIDK